MTNKDFLTIDWATDIRLDTLNWHENNTLVVHVSASTDQGVNVIRF